MSEEPSSLPVEHPVALALTGDRFEAARWERTLRQESRRLLERLATAAEDSEGGAGARMLDLPAEAPSVALPLNRPSHGTSGVAAPVRPTPPARR